jgi:hypothetical protein
MSSTIKKIAGAFRKVDTVSHPQACKDFDKAIENIQKKHDPVFSKVLIRAMSSPQSENLLDNHITQTLNENSHSKRMLETHEIRRASAQNNHAQYFNFYSLTAAVNSITIAASLAMTLQYIDNLEHLQNKAPEKETVQLQTGIVAGTASVAFGSMAFLTSIYGLTIAGIGLSQTSRARKPIQLSNDKAPALV